MTKGHGMGPMMRRTQAFGDPVAQHATANRDRYQKLSNRRRGRPAKRTTHHLHELRRVCAQSERLSGHAAMDRIIRYTEAEGDNGCAVLSQSKKDWPPRAQYRTLTLMMREGDLRTDGRCLLLTGN